MAEERAVEEETLEYIRDEETREIEEMSTALGHRKNEGKKFDEVGYLCTCICCLHVSKQQIPSVTSNYVGRRTTEEKEGVSDTELCIFHTTAMYGVTWVNSYSSNSSY